MQTYQTQPFQNNMNDSYFPSVLFNPSEFQYDTNFSGEVEISNQWILEYGLLSPPFDTMSGNQPLPSTSTSSMLNLDECNFLPYPQASINSQPQSYQSLPEQQSTHSRFSSIDSNSYFSPLPINQSLQNNYNAKQIFSNASDSTEDYIPRIFATLPTPLPSPTLSCHSSIYPNSNIQDNSFNDSNQYYDFSAMDLDNNNSPSPIILPSVLQTFEYQTQIKEESQQLQQRPQVQLQFQQPTYQQEEFKTTIVLQTPSPSTVEEEYVGTYVDLPRSNPTGAEGSCTPFVSKLAYLLRNEDLYRDVISWDQSGNTFIIAPSPKMLDDVLPTIFQHSSLAAFTRQLNTYGFKRLDREKLSMHFSHSPDTFTPLKELSAWSHVNFKRDFPGNLNLLTPQPSRARLLMRKSKLLLAESEFGVATGTAAAVVKSAITKVKNIKKKEKNSCK